MELIPSASLFLFLFLFWRLSVKDARKALYAIIFLTPSYLVRFSVLGIPATLLEIMTYVLFFSLIMEKKNSRSSLEKAWKSFYAERLLFFGSILLFLGVAASVCVSVNIRTSLGVLKGWFVDPFVFFLIFSALIKTRRQISYSVLSFILSGLAVGIIGLLYAAGSMFTFDGRLSAFYESPNYLAMYLAPGLLFAVYFLIFKREELREISKGRLEAMVCGKMICAFILAVFAAVILLTRSYGAVLGIAFACAFYLLEKYAGADNRKSLFSGKYGKSYLIIVVFFLLMFSLATYQKYEQIVNSNERSSFHSRIMIWNASVEMLKDSPIFGIGPGTFQKVYLDYQSRFAVPYLEWAVAEPHNTWLAFYLQSGIIGLAGFVILLFWIYEKSRHNDLVLIFLGYFLIHGLVDTLYWKNDLAFIFWMMVAIGFLSRNKQI